MRWSEARDAVVVALEAAGYDVDARDAALPEGGGSLTARRDRADGTVVIAVDAGGRFRATVTTLLDESASVRTIGGVPLRLQTRVTRATTAFGRLADVGDFSELLEAVDELPQTVPPPDSEQDDLRADSGGPW